ncbi:hypothetical protein [Inediibacterium massiliense]|nr:hypothetical protein [Inediibacterium massiliense]
MNITNKVLKTIAKAIFSMAFLISFLPCSFATGFEEIKAPDSIIKR